MLSDRLQLIYKHLKVGEPVWDLCCDHGYLGIVALKSKMFPQIHFVDQAQHLVLALQARWSVWPEAHFHPLPAENLSGPLTGTLVIAGVGGHKLLEILRALSAKGALRSQRLILGPHRDETLVTNALKTEFAHYRLDQSLSVQEGPRVRSIFILELKDDFRVD